MDACTVMKREKRHNASGISNEGMQFLAMDPCTVIYTTTDMILDVGNSKIVHYLVQVQYCRTSWLGIGV